MITLGNWKLEVFFLFFNKIFVQILSADFLTIIEQKKIQIFLITKPKVIKFRFLFK